MIASGQLPRLGPSADELGELASLLAAGYLRLLAARKAALAGQNPLDSPVHPSDELAMTTTWSPARG